MLSNDELTTGMTFILKLTDSHGTVSFWIETLRGETARHWYDIYRESDWESLRLEAMTTFHRRVTEAEADTVRGARQRCVFVNAQVDNLEGGA